MTRDAKRRRHNTETGEARSPEADFARRREHWSTFVPVEMAGEGTYGTVERATNPGGETVAIKKMKNVGRKAQGIQLWQLREIALLRSLEHENIARILDVMPSDSRAAHDAFWIYFEYCELDLSDILHHHKTNNTLVPYDSICTITFQLLQGLAYLHANGIVHRDIKPANTLISLDPEGKGTIRLGDFGLARSFRDCTRPLVADGTVVTLYYRAPELILGASNYGPRIDVWSAGCMFLELARLKPIFLGKELPRADGQSGEPFQRDQLRQICRFVPVPETLSESMHACAHLAELRHSGSTLDILKAAFARYPKGSLPAEALRDFVAKSLAMDPATRASAQELARHPIVANCSGKAWDCKGCVKRPLAAK